MTLTPKPYPNQLNLSTLLTMHPAIRNHIPPPQLKNPTHRPLTNKPTPKPIIAPHDRVLILHTLQLTCFRVPERHEGGADALGEEGGAVGVVVAVTD